MYKSLDADLWKFFYSFTVRFTKYFQWLLHGCHSISFLFVPSLNNLKTVCQIYHNFFSGILYRKILQSFRVFISFGDIWFGPPWVTKRLLLLFLHSPVLIMLNRLFLNMQNMMLLINYITNHYHLGKSKVKLNSPLNVSSFGVLFHISTLLY